MWYPRRLPRRDPTPLPFHIDYPVEDDEFDAKLTSYDSATGHYTFTEQITDSNGNFIDKPGGRTGTTGSTPAKTYNGEVISVSVSSPKYVRMRKRCLHQSYVVIYEIINPPAPSGCCGGQNTNCCPNVTIAQILIGTFSSSCSCVNGAVMTFIYTPAIGWVGYSSKDFDLCDTSSATFGFILNCLGSTTWRLDLNSTHSGGAGTTGCDFDAAGFVNSTVFTCSPFRVVFTGTMATTPPFSPCACAGNTWTLTIVGP